MPLVRTALIATAACLLGAAAYAQPATTDQAPPASAQAMPQTAPDSSAPATPADQAAPARSTSTDMSAPPAQTGAAANTSATVNASGVQVIASQPVPDTRANRAAFGQPLSRGGQRTKAAGN